MPKRKKGSIKAQRKYKNYGWMKLLCGLGGTVSMVFFAVGIFLSIDNPSAILNVLIFSVLGIVVDITLLSSFDLLGLKLRVEVSWFSILVLGILDAVFRYLSGVGGVPLYGYLGTFCIIIASFIGIVEKL